MGEIDFASRLHRFCNDYNKFSASLRLKKDIIFNLHHQQKGGERDKKEKKLGGKWKIQENGEKRK